MKKNEPKGELTKAHIVLFAVSLLAVLLTAGSYMRGALRERRIETAAANNGGNRGAMGGFNPQQMAARRLEQMTQQLQLSAEQVTKIKAIQESAAPRLKALFDDATLTRPQRREKMRPLRAESEAQIRQILTSEQQVKYDAMQAQRRAQFGGGNFANEGRSNGNAPSGNAPDANVPSVNAPSVTAPPPMPRN